MFKRDRPARSVLLSLKQDDVEERKELTQKYVDSGASRAEAERLMILALFRREIRHLIKKIEPDRLKRAVDEALVEEVHES